MHQATLKTISRDGRHISEALNRDNGRGDKLKIVTESKGDKITTKIRTHSIRTLLSTLDDVIHCQIVAEKLI